MSLKTRLEALERAVTACRTVFVCLNSPEETSEQAIARHLAEYPQDARARLLTVHTAIYRSPGDPLPADLTEGDR